MRSLFFSLFVLSAATCFGQIDSITRSKGESPRTAQQPVMIPGIDSPTSAPGTLLQSPPNPNAAAPAKDDKKRRRTNAPSNPRAFGVAVPLGKSKRDTLR
ncbi:hypothetical protein [Spirosoma pomorum]